MRAAVAAGSVPAHRGGQTTSSAQVSAERKVSQAFDALQISLNAIHGWVFFAQFHLDSVHSSLTTPEPFIGIVVEGVFVAMTMLVLRCFGSK